MRKHQCVARRDLDRRLFKTARHALVNEPNATFSDEARARRPRLGEPSSKEPNVYPLPFAQAGPPRRRRGGASVGGSRLASAENALSCVAAFALPLRFGLDRRHRLGWPSSACAWR